MRCPGHCILPYLPRACQHTPPCLPHPPPPGFNRLANLPYLRLPVPRRTTTILLHLPPRPHPAPHPTTHPTTHRTPPPPTPHTHPTTHRTRYTTRTHPPHLPPPPPPRHVLLPFITLAPRATTYRPPTCLRVYARLLPLRFTTPSRIGSPAYAVPTFLPRAFTTAHAGRTRHAYAASRTTRHYQPPLPLSYTRAPLYRDVGDAPRTHHHTTPTATLYSTLAAALR